MLHVVMDGAGDMPSGWKEDFEIDVIPINIQFGQKSYLQGIEMSNDDFYQLADQTGTVPKTAQPSPQQFIDFYRKIAQPGEAILSMHVTSKLSGTFDSAKLAAQEVKDEFRVYPLDSMSGSAALGYMCKEARLLDRAGASIEQILRRMDYIRQHVNIVLTLNSLEYARRSGRVKALQAALASLLNVKPIIELRDGMLDMAGRVRTRGKALEHVIERVKERVKDQLVNVAVVHARDPEAGRELMRRVKQVLNCNELIMTDLSISVAANLGPGTIGIVAYPD
jgi:DegV family protein with EDD domain